nr:MAG TPA: hypothetical protein [Caudoviricetes sp.]
MLIYTFGEQVISGKIFHINSASILYLLRAPTIKSYHS